MGTPELEIPEAQSEMSKGSSNKGKSKVTLGDSTF